MAITFDKTTGLYQRGTSTLSRGAIRLEVKKIERWMRRESRVLSRQLIRGELFLVEWQIGMRDIIKAGHVLAGAIGYGGVEQMTAARWGEVGRTLRRQYAYLNNFARQVERGQVIFESQLAHRAGRYAFAIRATYYQGESTVAEAAGYTKSRRVLHALETCMECRSWAQKGAVPIGEQPPIGGLRCGQFCLCTLTYSYT